MGEAKRRRDRIEQEKEMRSIFTGDRLKLRQSDVTPRELLVQIRETAEAEGRGERPEVRVPCGKCRECCWHMGVDVDPEEEPKENLEKLQLEQRDGTYYLRKRDDGACVHLGDEGCTVYEYRPRACRGYDCRPFSLTGILDSYDGDHQAPAWNFRTEHPADKAITIAMRMGSFSYVEKQMRGEEIGKSAADIWPEALEAAIKGNFQIAAQLVDWVENLGGEDKREFLVWLGKGMKQFAQQAEARWRDK